MANKARLPTFYISHGGGPCFWMQDAPPPFGGATFHKLRDYLAGLLQALPQRPAAILIVSAHWEEKIPTFGTSVAPPMLFDYYGFPPHTYQLNYPASGAPELAARAGVLLKAAGIESGTDSRRGFDHGVFVPMLIVDPAAEIPILTLSLNHNLDPAQHLAMGAALEKLRDENVLVIGSGSSYHNLREFFDGVAEASTAFDDWLNDVIMKTPAERNKALIAWTTAPFARACHPREEHLLPLMVAAGAAGHDHGRSSFQDSINGKKISCFVFG